MPPTIESPSPSKINPIYAPESLQWLADDIRDIPGISIAIAPLVQALKAIQFTRPPFMPTAAKTTAEIVRVNLHLDSLVG